MSKKANKGKSGKRKPVFHPEFKQDLQYWIDHNWKIALRALRLVEEIVDKDPFTGTGKPEHLKGLPDTWSRRLTQEHRIVYLVRESRIDFLQARYHY